jgi:hypothetical protein
VGGGVMNSAIPYVLLIAGVTFLIIFDGWLKSIGVVFIVVSAIVAFSRKVK